MLITFPESSERHKFCSEKLVSNELGVGPAHGRSRVSVRRTNAMHPFGYKH